MRLPIVMAVANRALSAPLSVWGDHSDVMAVRDTSWIQIFAENGQQALDQTICAFRIGEDPNVLFPVMVHLDGFHLSHVVEGLEMVEKSTVDRFLPKFNYPYALNPDAPVTMGAFAMPNFFTETKKAQDVAFLESKPVILQAWKEYAELTGRQYQPVEHYRTENASVLLLTMGSFSETAMVAVDELREKGEKVGLIRLRLWRPFPFQELQEAVQDAQVLVVLDRCLSYGGPPGPVCSEVKAAMYSQDKKPKIVGFVGGLGGRDIAVQEFVYMIHKGIELADKGREDETEIIGVRG